MPTFFISAKASGFTREYTVVNNISGVNGGVKSI